MLKPTISKIKILSLSEKNAEKQKDFYVSSLEEKVAPPFIHSDPIITSQYTIDIPHFDFVFGLEFLFFIFLVNQSSEFLVKTKTKQWWSTTLR